MALTTSARSPTDQQNLGEAIMQDDDITIDSTKLPVPSTAALTARIAAAYLTHNSASVSDLPVIIRSIHSALRSAGSPIPEPVAEKPVPAVPVKKSITADHIVCLEDGKKLKMLKRHLATTYGLTPDEYRAKWGLPPDYPMTAPNYAAQRSAFAKATGLGRQSVIAPAEATSEKRKPGRPRRNADE